MRMGSRHLEELTLDAWPPLQTLLYDGWLLGFSGGYTRRANSVQPLYPSTLPLSDKIATCEAMFADRGLPIAFKVTSGSADPDLDATLLPSTCMPSSASASNTRTGTECGCEMFHRPRGHTHAKLSPCAPWAALGSGRCSPRR
jgi:hypothetical protein